MARVLIADDDQNVLSHVKTFLESQGHLVESCNRGDDAVFMLKTYPYELVVLDWQMPGASGVDVCKEFRSRGGKTPVLMLTGMTDVSDKEQGLDAGADDYLTKPFELRELGARVRALLRRPAGVLDTVLVAGNIRYDLGSKKTYVDGVEADLMPKEFQLLEFLLRHPNHTYTFESILNQVWPSDSESTVAALRSTVKRMRKKIDPLGKIICTVHGVGYILRTEFPED